MASNRPCRCAAPGCGRVYAGTGSCYRHWRDEHPELTGGLSSHHSWWIPINQGGQNAGGGSNPPVGGQAVAPGTAGGAGGATAIVGVVPTAVPPPPPPPAPAPTPTPTPAATTAAPALVAPVATAAPARAATAPVADPLPLLLPLPSYPRPPEELRSSRSTRNQDHNTAPRNRAGVIDWDPTEGLPVRKWEQVTVKVNQDATSDPADSNNHSAENNDSDFPWPEQPLPHFFNQLPPHSQELLRRARMGNTNVKPLVWDRKTQSWISSSEVDARNARLKSKHLLNNPDSPASNDEDDNEDTYDVDGAPGKRRKTNSGLQERIFETKKWVQIPAAIAEKLAEPKYLADRRPGMESLYGGAYKATNGFGSLGINPGAGSGAAGFDMGDGSGLGNAPGVLGSGTAVPEPAPVRKNMPPKRKKKKLGGPGRKKANPVPTGDNTPATQPSDVVMTDTPIETPSQQAFSDIKPGDTQIEEAEGSGSDSEGEGSEEGEIEEEGKAQSQPQTVLATASNTEGTPEVHQSKDEDMIETLGTTAVQAVTSKLEVMEVPASALVPEPTPDVSMSVSSPRAAEMQDVLATEVIPAQEQTPQPTTPSVQQETAATAIPGLDTKPASIPAPAETQGSEELSNPQAAPSIEDTETDVRPVLEQITPEPTPISTEIEVTIPTAPLDAEVEVQEAQSPSQSKPQLPQILSESSNGPAEENTPVVPTTGLVSDKIIPSNPSEISPSAIDSAVQNEAVPSAPEPSTTTTLSVESTILENIESTEEGHKDPASTSAQVEAAATEGEVDLLGGLEAAVDKEANTSATTVE